MPIGSTNEEDPKGDWETCKIQSKRRIVLSQQYMDYHDMEVGEECIVVCRDEGLEVLPNTRDSLRKLIED